MCENCKMFLYEIDYLRETIHMWQSCSCYPSLHKCYYNLYNFLNTWNHKVQSPKKI